MYFLSPRTITLQFNLYSVSLKRCGIDANETTRSLSCLSKSQLVTVSHYRSKFGLHHRVLAKTPKQQVFKGPIKSGSHWALRVTRD